MLYRTVIIKQPDNGWWETKFEDLKVGDHFQMREPTGELVMFHETKQPGTWIVEECHFDHDPPGVKCTPVEIET